MNEWTIAEKKMPPKNRIVMTKSRNGQEQALYFDQMWWVPDGSMYVYYQVVEWREMTRNEREKESLLLSEKSSVATEEAKRLRALAVGLT